MLPRVFVSKEANGLKLLIEPGQEEQKILDGQSRICNWLYNDLLDKAQTYKKQSKKGIRNREGPYIPKEDSETFSLK